ncbi:thioredoxin domain-containing protein, partial [Enterococcus faecalis]|uniref:thioredoxin domain-containing protein n=1 Tax=Enterococcus faecalis TaxID=1351 RepID=UPI003D6BE8DC
KESLQRGNVMHHYIHYSAPEQAVSTLHKMFATQDEWANLTLEEVATYAEKNLGLKEQKHATLVSAVIAEANAAHIQFVP